jgi:[ribosomal protein S5]-alanine N-acetyltransferase
MKAPAEFETARLWLRQPQMSDAAAIFERYASDREVTKFLGWPCHETVRDTEGFLEFSAQEWRRWPAGPYLITLREDGRLLGSTGLGFQAPHDAMTGYVLAKDAWGKGYATEALAGMLEVAASIGVTRLSALCHPEHGPSRRVLEKCGFVRDSSTPLVEFPNLSARVKLEALCYVRAIGAGEDHAE